LNEKELFGELEVFSVKSNRLYSVICNTLEAEVYFFPIQKIINKAFSSHFFDKINEIIHSKMALLKNRYNDEINSYKILDTPKNLYKLKEKTNYDQEYNDNFNNKNDLCQNKTFNNSFSYKSLLNPIKTLNRSIDKNERLIINRKQSKGILNKDINQLSILRSSNIKDISNNISNTNISMNTTNQLKTNYTSFTNYSNYVNNTNYTYNTNNTIKSNNTINSNTEDVITKNYTYNSNNTINNVDLTISNWNNNNKDNSSIKKNNTTNITRNSIMTDKRIKIKTPTEKMITYKDNIKISNNNLIKLIINPIKLKSDKEEVKLNNKNNNNNNYELNKLDTIAKNNNFNQNTRSTSNNITFYI